MASSAFDIYFCVISLSGFFILLIFSFLAFANVESLRIKEDKSTNSGVILLINAIIYLGIGIALLCKIRRSSIRKGYMRHQNDTHIPLDNLAEETN